MAIEQPLLNSDNSDSVNSDSETARAMFSAGVFV